MDYDLPEDIAALSAEDLARHITEANAALTAALAEEPSTEVADRAEALAAGIAALEAEAATRDEAATSAADRMEALRAARIEASDDTDDDGEEDDDEQPETDEDEGEVEGENDEPEVEAVAAAARPARRTSARKALAKTRPATKPQGSSRATIAITAAADVPGFATGSSMDDLLSVAEAVEARVRAFPGPAGIEGAPLQRYGVAQFKTAFPEDLIGGDTGNDFEVIQRAAKESRLEGGNLIASGGWCAPSETIYDLCAGETTDGIIDLPEIQVKRGGIRTTPGPQFSDFYNAGFKQTEAQAISGTTKTCYTVTCPTFTDQRLDAVGLCLKFGLLQNAAWPELTRRVVSGTLIAHQHKVAADLITAMVTKSTAITVADVGSVTSGSLNAAGLVASTIRQDYRLGLNETLEVVFPVWAREAFRADLSMRTGVDLLAISDAQIESFFNARKVRPQWVYNWQDLADNEEGYPSTLKMLVYPAGTFVKGRTDVISLDAVYDAASLATNDYTGLFVEEGVLLNQTCFKSKVVTVPLCAAGKTGIANNAGCFTLTP